MYFYINSGLGYYEGDRISSLDQPVEKRPDEKHKWNGSAWVQDASAIECDTRLQRANAYREESDPVFFKSQRGEAMPEEWLAKVAEIKARFPKP